MRPLAFNLDFVLITIAIVAVILHGSLYPYDFRIPTGSEGALRALLQSWATPPSSFGDLIANVLLYMPFGFFAARAIRPQPSLLSVTVIGFLICASIELVQFYDQGRVTSMSDVYANTFGSCLGGLCRARFRSHTRSPFLAAMSAQPIPSLLLIAMLGYRLYPYVPTIDLHKYWHSLKFVVLTPSFAPYFILHYFSIWLTVAYLIANLLGANRAPVHVVLVLVLVMGSKILIIHQFLTASEVVGAVLAYGFWAILLNYKRAVPLVVTAVLCLAIVLLRLEPFAFTATARPFGWVPFRSFLTGSLELDIVSFFEKVFLYGSLIWTCSKIGLGLWKATGVVVVLLLSTSLLETYLPSRSAEITDALMALLIGAIFTTVNKAAIRERTLVNPSPKQIAVNPAAPEL